MLTEEQRHDAARLESQVGENRPGYLRDNVCALEGPSVTGMRAAASGSGVRRAAKGKKSGHKKISVRLAFETDPKTGERRTVRK